jgi:beta-lactamase regulating signal transducer with metallopeptidase domain
MIADLLKTLLANSLAFSALFAIFLPVRRLLSRRVSAALQYMLWAVVVVKLVMPFGFESAISPMNFIAPPEKGILQEARAGDEAEAVRPEIGAGPESMPEAENEALKAGTPMLSVSPEKEGAAQTPAAPETRAPFDWTLTLFALWATGTLATAATMCVIAGNLRRRIGHTLSSPSGRITGIFEDCRRELRMGTRIGIYTQSVLGAPVVTGLFRPMLILPEDVEAQDDDAIRHICMHELLHVKSKDLPVILALNILNAVYWFNPLTWVCFGLIRKDMEAVCDSRVLKRIGTCARQDYIGTVLQYAGLGREEYRPYAAIGMADGRLTMEKRIKNMFRATRTGLRGRIAAACTALLLFAACVLTACQPTPEKVIVQSKNNDSVKKAIESAAANTAPAEMHTYSAPKTWKGSLHDADKKIDVNIDAKVIVPKDTWGIYELVPKKPDRAYLDTVLKTLIGDAEIYAEDTYRSKEEIQDEIIRIKADIARIKNESGESEKAEAGNGASGDESAPKDMMTGRLEEELAQCEQALKDAPDKKTTKRSPVDLDILLGKAVDLPKVNPAAIGDLPSVSVYENGNAEVRGMADTGKAKPAEAYLFASKDWGISISLRNAGRGNAGFSGREPLTKKPLFKVKLSQDKAADIARQAVDQMGFGYLGIAAVHKMELYDKPRMEGDKMPECYAFTFSRSLDGVPATYAYSDGVMDDEQDPQYSVRWHTSEALIGVDDSGVVYADIHVPQSDVNRLAAGIELKRFEDIIDIFNKQAVVEGCFSSMGSPEMVVGRTVNVDEIRLGYMPTIWKDHPNQVIFVPVWDFFGSEVTQYDKNYAEKEQSDLYASLDKNYQRKYDLEEQAILTINALDGTIMKRI